MNAPSPLFPRLIEVRVAEALADTPVVLITGPRQAGKTTLVRQIADQGLRYLTLDDELSVMSRFLCASSFCECARSPGSVAALARISRN